jgi:hypothetical protein
VSLRSATRQEERARVRIGRDDDRSRRFKPSYGRISMTRSPGRTRSLCLTFGDATCLPVIRRWLRSTLTPIVGVEPDAELVCCELVTNAIEHGGGAGAVRIDISGEGQVRVEVDDADPAGALTVGRSRFGDNRGRGLTIVNTIAEWGVRRTATGKTVWATLI